MSGRRIERAAVAAALLLAAGCGTIDIPTAIEFDCKDILYPLPASERYHATPTPTPGWLGK